MKHQLLTLAESAVGYVDTPSASDVTDYDPKLQTRPLDNRHYMGQTRSVNYYSTVSPKTDEDWYLDDSDDS
jgi:hypothetical protein